MSRSALVRRSLFDESSQWLDDFDPTSVKLLGDRVLIRDIPQNDQRIGSIWIPEVSQTGGVGKTGLLRVGEVVACGPGDKYIELWAPDRKTGKPVPMLDRDGYAIRDYLDERLPMYVKPGDVVVYDRRKEAEIYVGRERFQMCHEEQAIIGVLHEKSRLDCIHDWVILKRELEKHHGILYIPDSAKQPSRQAKVIACGPGRRGNSGKVRPVDVQPGESVILSKWAAETTMTLNNREVILTRESSILCATD